MGDLILNSLEIRNFRGFEHLKIDRLGRVNLIIGKNNIGKSSLLEALRLYAQRGNPNIIWDILGTHDENMQPPSSRSVTIEDLLFSLKYLFYGRKEIVRGQLRPITIGPIGSTEDTLTIAIGWYIPRIDEDGMRKLQLLESEDSEFSENPVPRFVIQIGNQQRLVSSIRLDPFTPARLLESDLKEIVSVYVSVNGLERKKGQVGFLWDSIALTPLEKEVLEALRIIAPGVEGLNFVGEMQSQRYDLRSDTVRPPSHIRFPIVRIAEIDGPIPLRSLGDGMQRMLEIILALVNAKDGIALIDEVENGLHYAVQEELWLLIFQLAQRLNVQVFATTHSWDCIEGFQKAAHDTTQVEGMLIRLSLKKDEVVATNYDEEDLVIVTKQGIEVR